MDPKSCWSTVNLMAKKGTVCMPCVLEHKQFSHSGRQLFVIYLETLSQRCNSTLSIAYLGPIVAPTSSPIFTGLTAQTGRYITLPRRLYTLTPSLKPILKPGIALDPPSPEPQQQYTPKHTKHPETPPILNTAYATTVYSWHKHIQPTSHHRPKIDQQQRC